MEGGVVAAVSGIPLVHGVAEVRERRQRDGNGGSRRQVVWVGVRDGRPAIAWLGGAVGRHHHLVWWRVRRVGREERRRVRALTLVHEGAGEEELVLVAHGRRELAGELGRLLRRRRRRREEDWLLGC